MNDTRPEARAFQLRGWSRMSAAQRLEQLRSCWRTGSALAAMGKRWRGETALVTGGLVEQLEVTRLVTQALEATACRYAVVGSVASSIHGEPRYTQDTDLLAEVDRERMGPLLALETDFYLSEVAVAEALARKSSFNLIHLQTNFKIDVFVSRNRPFDRSRLERRVFVPEAGFYVATPEDVLLAKLEWFRLGGEVSERQWRDVESIVGVQSNLDRDYLTHWAAELQVDDLLLRLFG